MVTNNNWAKEAVFYHIYPLGLCGCPRENKGKETEGHRFLQVLDWIDHLKELGVNAVYFGPLWESVTHGYDTTDYKKLDSRLGDNADMKRVCDALHKAGIRVVVDGVFNHVGRQFFAFLDVKEKRENSPYKDWIAGLNFWGNNGHNDGFSYENWHGNEPLVKLNLYNDGPCQYLLDAINYWIDEFDIDGIRLDAADCIQMDFFKKLHGFCKNKKSDFWLMGEIIHGDYSRWANGDMMDSVTNYECWKGIYSSHNDHNYFEINYAMRRQWGQGGIYQKLHLYNFVDNHDVNRIASLLKEKDNLENVYTLLFTMPGVPSIYYGSEFPIEGEKNKGDVGDYPLRPALDIKSMPKNTALMEHIKTLSDIRRETKCFSYGPYDEVLVRNEYLIFGRSYEGENGLVALNCTSKPVHASCDYKGRHFDMEIPAYGARIYIY